MREPVNADVELSSDKAAVTGTKTFPTDLGNGIGCVEQRDMCALSTFSVCGGFVVGLGRIPRIAVCCRSSDGRHITAVDLRPSLRRASKSRCWTIWSLRQTHSCSLYRCTGSLQGGISIEEEVAEGRAGYRRPGRIWTRRESDQARDPVPRRLSLQHLEEMMAKSIPRPWAV
jgi:hypothetical protein